MLIVPRYGVLCELCESGGDALRLGKLPRPHPGPFLVEHVLHLHCEDLSELVELLGAYRGERKDM